MYLKRLEIQGFKSFANKAVLDFLGPRHSLGDGEATTYHSITAIVGPNGAGKSNVTDAIRWVMGETSMKNLRGKKSEDVIFNGSDSKGALSAAEVTMILDNSNDLSPTPPLKRRGNDREPSLFKEGEEGGQDFNFNDLPEIAITRRLYRSGESEYLVNNNPVRLFDIHLLLAKAKFAEHAYSIVSQGMIDRLLTVSPSERKDFFDEASGIKEHQIKEHQAELKLARTKENMQQAANLLAEVEPRLRILAKQVKKLEKRQEVEKSLIETQEKYYLTLYTKNQTELDVVQGSLNAVEKEYRAAFENLEKIQNELAELARGATRQEVFDELQAKHREAVRVKNDAERQLAIIAGQMHTEYREAGAQNVGWLEGKIAEAKATEEKQSAELQSSISEAERKSREVAEQRKKIDNLFAEQSQLKLKISRLQNQLLKDQSEQNYREFSGLGAVKAVLDAKNRFGKVYGLLAELGEVEEEYRLALEVAAGGHLSSLVVENEDVARLSIEYLRENRFGVASFLPLNKIIVDAGARHALPLPGDAGIIGRAIDLIKFDDKFANIFNFALRDTLVVKDLHAAKRLGIGNGRYVTLEGDLVEKKGVMRGGFRRRAGVGFSSRLSLVSEDRLSEIQADINAQNHNLEELEKSLDNAKAKLMELEVASGSIQNKAGLLTAEHDGTLAEIAKLGQELSLCTATPKEYGRQIERLANEKKVLDAALLGEGDKILKIEKEIENFNKKEEEKKQRVFSLQEQMQKKQAEVNVILNRRSELNIERAKLETKQEDLSAEVEADMKVSIHSIVKRLAGAAEQIRHLADSSLPELADTIQKLKYQLSLIGGIDEEVVAEYGATKERYDFLNGQLKDLSAATEDLEKMIEELNELMKKKRSAAFKKIRKEFDRYFKILFNGGTADLEEVYGPPPSPEDSGEPSEAAMESVESLNANKVLTGIDVIANPPGKKVKYLNMLSGGERTLTSIALICAILHNNPSPFVVLDEVEAALDEANTLRFAKIMAELSAQSQFIVVTHNRVTMHAAGALYGVVMASDGVSKLLGVKIEDVPQYEDKEPAKAVDKANVL